MLRNCCLMLFIGALIIYAVPVQAETDAALCKAAYKAQKFKDALPLCLRAANAEDADSKALISLASLYESGQGVTKDEAEAVKWYRKAAEQGNASAQYDLGGMCLRKRDYTEAVKWFRKAAEQGYAIAQVVLGAMYSSGKEGLKQDYSEALSLFRKAADQGQVLAQYYIGLAYDKGHGVKQDRVEAYHWFQKAAESGDSNSQILLGIYYSSGSEIKQDYAEALNWFQKAADQGQPVSQYSLGLMYANGFGIEQDYSKAITWYRKAAEQRDASAQEALGSMYRRGIGVPKNYAEAMRWFQKSAEQGDSGGQGALGAAYYNGEGVVADKVQALAWFTLAAASNDKAAKARDHIEKELKPIEITKAQQLATKLQTEIDTRIKQEPLAKTDQNSPSKLLAKILFPSLIPTPSAKPFFTSNDIAIIIGIERYRTVPPTEYAAADAGMVRDYLKALGIPERNIEFLADDRATLSDIRKVIETKLPNMVKANSRVIVYYAGHGAPGTARGESYLVPYDGDPSFLADTAYPLSRLYDRLSRLNAKEVLVILDSCFSGAGGRSVLAKNTRPLVMVKDTPPPASKKMIVMTSSRGSQITTSLPETGHGAFTYFFLRALQEGNRDIGEVYAYLNPRVTEEAKRQNVDQTPTISPAADKLKGRFLFAR